MNKKILLIHSHSKEELKNIWCMPLGIHQLGACLKQTGYQCDMFDGYRNKWYINKIISYASQYDLIGIGSNMDGFDNATNIANGIKQIKNIPIILGGYHGIFNYEDILNNHSCFDCIVRGEGEEVIIKLVEDYFTNGKFTIPLPGVSYLNLNGKKIISHEMCHVKDLDSLPFPIRENLIDYRHIDTKYTRNGWLVIIIESGRGCQFNCIYCAVPKSRKKCIIKSVDRIIEEVLDIDKNYDMMNHHKKDLIYFTDNSLFLSDIDRVKELVVKLRKVTSMNFGFNARVDQIIKAGSDFIKYLADEGCSFVEIGIESGSQSQLDRYKKGTTVEQNLEAIKIMTNVSDKITTVMDFLLFDPYTTIDELKENVEFFKKSGLSKSKHCRLRREFVSDYRLGPIMERVSTSIYNKPLQEYFIYPEIYKIYQCCIRFKEDHLINLLKINYNFIDLKYNLLEYLVNNHTQDIYELYEIFLRENSLE